MTRSWTFAVAVLCASFLCASGAHAQFNPSPDPEEGRLDIRITTINGASSVNHPASIAVRPGDSLMLSADLFDGDSGEALRVSPRDFIWSGNDVQGDQCDPSRSWDCARSQFEVTREGVVFHVPLNLGPSMRLRVWSKNPSAIDRNGYAKTDHIVLVNQMAEEQIASPLRTRVRITSVNGVYGTNHPMHIGVHEGDVLNFGAELLDIDQGYQPTRAPVEAFVWRGSDSADDHCDGLKADRCLDVSNFQVTDYGVSFYVPSHAGPSITISVTSRDPSSRLGQGVPLSDSIILDNLDYRPDVVVTAPAVILDPLTYPAATLDANIALAGMGHWIWIGEVRYFVPTTYVIPGGPAVWEPYRHGSWQFDPVRGWTWASYDPWGWMTDHYGVWRHHGVYGWIWLPFADHHYEPHCVTWFDDNAGHVGWYPYFGGYSAGYAHGYQDGFDDGFWAGVRAAGGFGNPGFAYHPGFTIVERTQVTNVNISVVAMGGVGVSFTSIVQTSFTANRVYAVPGGSFEVSRTWVERGALVPAPVFAAREVVSPGGARFVFAASFHPTPPVYHEVVHVEVGARPIAIGSVAVLKAEGHAPTIVPPTVNGRGVAFAPKVIDEHGKTIGFVPASAKTQAQFNPQNPFASHLQAAAPTVTTGGAHAQASGPATLPAVPVNQMPRFQPSQAAPAPIAPRPAPAAAPTTPSAPPHAAAPVSAPQAAAPQAARPVQTAPTQPTRPTQPVVAQPAPQPSAPALRPSVPAAPTSQPMAQPARPPQAPVMERPTRPEAPAIERPMRPQPPSQSTSPQMPNFPRGGDSMHMNPNAPMPSERAAGPATTDRETGSQPRLQHAPGFDRPVHANDASEEPSEPTSMRGGDRNRESSSPSPFGGSRGGSMGGFGGSARGAGGPGRCPPGRICD